MKAMLRFRARDGICVMPMEHVIGVRSQTEIKPFPGRRADVAGVVDLDGAAIPVLSTLADTGNHILLLRTQWGAFGALVTDVLGVVRVEDSQLQPAPGGRAEPLVGGVLKTGEGFELVISAEQLGQSLSEGHARADSAGSRLADELPLHLLLVEDNPVMQIAAKRLLTKLGYAIDVAATGRQAIDAIGHAAYDVVLMDVQMPEMDGLEAMREIKRLWPSARPTVIAMTAGGDDADRRACIDMGMDDFLVKPVREAALSATLRKWAPRNRSSAPRGRVPE